MVETGGGAAAGYRPRRSGREGPRRGAAARGRGEGPRRGARATVLEHTRRKLDVEGVHHLPETGRIGPAEPVQLVDGELLAMPAIGTRRASVASRLIERLIRLSARHRVMVTGATPLRLDRYDEFAPDALVVKRRDDGDARSHPGPADTVLVIEMAKSTRAFDLGRKAELCASSDVAEYSVVDLVARQVPVHRAPTGDADAETAAFAPGTLTPQLLAEVALDVAAVSP